MLSNSLFVFARYPPAPIFFLRTVRRVVHSRRDAGGLFPLSNGGRRSAQELLGDRSPMTYVKFGFNMKGLSPPT